MAEPRWYIVHAYSNFEKKVASTIREQADMQGLGDLIVEIEVPTEEVVEVVRGRKRTVEKRHMPGYVLVKMLMTDEVYHLVKNTPKVTGFVGDALNPPPAAVASALAPACSGRSTSTTSSGTSSAPNRSAWARISSIRAGPMMPSGKPGKFSTSVVSISWPPGWSLVEDGSPSSTTGARLARAV